MRPPHGGGGRRRRSRRRHASRRIPGRSTNRWRKSTSRRCSPRRNSAEKTKTELLDVAKELEIEIPTPAKLKKDEIVELLVQGQIARSGIEVASGILDILPEGYGFLRRAGYYIGNDDIYVSQSQIRRFELRRGDMVEGHARRPKESEKYYGLDSRRQGQRARSRSDQRASHLRKRNADLSAGAV